MSAPERDRPRLLLVDDDSVFLEDVVLLLDRDFDCVCETDPGAVVEAAARTKPDAVLLDLDFDGVLLGFDILEALRAEFPDLPIFLWSEAREEEVWPRGLGLGATGLLSKTAPPHVILERLSTS